jgi:hypothetical protein
MRKNPRPWGFRLTALLAATCFALPAHAHGQEVLTSLYAQLASVTVALTALFGVRECRRYWLAGLLGCISGTVLSWWVTGGMPYRQHANLITLILAVAPIAFLSLSIFAASRWARHRARSNNSLERARER